MQQTHRNRHNMGAMLFNASLMYMTFVGLFNLNKNLWR